MKLRSRKVPTVHELTKAIGKFKNGKAGGASGILPEMVEAACCEDDFLELLLDLVQAMWKEGEVPKDWSDALFVPIPKNGDLSECDNWRGIALLDTVGKVVARIIQERLQTLAEEELPGSQYAWLQERTWML